MEVINTWLAVLSGLLVRLAIPIFITVLAVSFLRKLDERWQKQAEIETPEAKVPKPECWKVRDCPPPARGACPGFLSPLPCWQVYRLPNGYLREECLTCEVFRAAPAPAQAQKSVF